MYGVYNVTSHTPGGQDYTTTGSDPVYPPYRPGVVSVTGNNFLLNMSQFPKEECSACARRHKRPYKGHSPEMSSTPKNPKISIRTHFLPFLFII